MEKKAFELICKSLEESLKKHGFSTAKSDTSNSEIWQTIYKSDNKAFSVNWLKTEKKYKFYKADVSDGEYSDFEEISVWIFDPDNNDESDAKSIAADFEESALSLISGKAAVSVKRDQRSAKKTPKMNCEEFFKTALEIYPQFKTEYDSNISYYGRLNPDELAEKTLGIYMMEMLSKEKNAQLKKLFGLFDTGYMKGDNEVRSVIMVTILGMLLGHEKEEELSQKYISDAMKPVWIQTKKILIRKNKRRKEHE